LLTDQAAETHRCDVQETAWTAIFQAPGRTRETAASTFAVALGDVVCHLSERTKDDLQTRTGARDDEAGKNDWVRAIIDVPGVGGGVVDRLVELELPVVPYNGGEAPIDKERFVNARAEDYWTLRERFEQGEIDIDLDDDKLAA
jgi:hypothetical protein